MFGVSLGIIDSGGAGGGAGAFESIATITLTSTVLNNDFTGIPQTYKHLQLRVIGRVDDTGTNAGPLKIRVGNGSIDTGANYTRHSLLGTGSAASSNASVSQTNVSLRDTLPENSALADAFGVAIIDIHDYSSTTKNKTIRAFHGNDRNAAGAGNIYLTSGLWINTNAINQIRLDSDGSGLKAGTVISLYGIKG